MTTIIAGIAVGLLLLWGGIFALLRLVVVFERKHVFVLGGYTTLVAGLVMGLVLFTAAERQQEHRAELQQQMDTVTRRLSDLSERLVGQLSEKADLTASEFEIRARLQTEQADHARTREDLAQKEREYEELDQVLDRERKANRAYQDDINRKLDEHFTSQGQRYQSIGESLEVHRRAVQGIQKHLESLQHDVGKANAQVAELATGQSDLLAKVNAARQVGDSNAQKVDALARSQKALQDDLVRTIAQVDSLYSWKKK